MDDSEEFQKKEKSAAQYAEDFKAEYWSTSSKTGTHSNPDFRISTSFGDVLYDIRMHWWGMR